MPVAALAVIFAGTFGGLLWWGNKRKQTGAAGGATPVPTNPQGKTQT